MSAVLAGHRKLTHRRILVVPQRALVCPANHKHKAQPYLLGPVGLSCGHRPPPGDAGLCARCAAYFPLPLRRVLVVEASSSELVEMGELDLGPEAMARYLELPWPLRY